MVHLRSVILVAEKLNLVKKQFIQLNVSKHLKYQIYYVFLIHNTGMCYSLKVVEKLGALIDLPYVMVSK